MKKLFTLSVLIFLVAIFGVEAETQKLKVPGVDLASQVLGILDKTDGLGLSADQTTKLKANNKSFVDDVFGVLNGNLSDDAKKSKFLDLKKIRQNFLLGLLGQSLLGKYNGSVNKLLGPLKSQLGPAALAF
jgi:hypothetical protein